MLGREKFMGVDIQVRVKGGGHVSQTCGKELSFRGFASFLLYSFYLL